MTKAECTYKHLATELAKMIDSDLSRQVVEEHAYAALQGLIDALSATQTVRVSGCLPRDVSTTYTNRID